MKIVRGIIIVVVVVSIASSLPRPASAEEVQEEQPVEKWSVLGMITGYHSVVHKAAGLEVRVLEADGSASVAWDPVSLFVVVTNNGTSDGEQHVWRLPQGVVRVRALSPTTCGADVQVYVDKIGKGELVVGSRATTFHLCFLSPTNALLPKLTVSELKKPKAPR
jgi:hypothetical protein